MAEQWHVIRRRNGRDSVLFEGNESDARAFLQNNYPRVHVEPGSPDSGVPDALLKSPSGNYSAFHGPETGFVDTDKEGQVQEKKSAAKKTAEPAKKTTEPAKQTAPASFGGNA